MVKVSQSHLRIGIALSSILIVSVLFYNVKNSVSAAPDYPCAGAVPTEQVDISIAAGETGSEIARSLFTEGVTKSSLSFFRIAVSNPKSARIAPGIHRLDKGICAKQALEQLLDSSRISGLINIVEGAWVSEIVPQLQRSGMSIADVATAMRSIKKPEGFSTLEGLLFPAQYSFATGTPAKTALQSMVDRAVAQMKTAGFFSPSNKFNPQQLLTIASLVQAEGNTEDFPRISQVIRNRIVKGMPLQFDSTVHYVKKTRGTVFLSTESTLIHSPYNTYIRYGLPPGPINNPGAAALSAAVNPLPGDWLYFITVAPFDTRFTSDINEFNQWKIEYKKNLRAGKFRRKN